MTYTELVIKIPTELYNLIQDKLDFNGDLKQKDTKTLMLAIDNGTPLPKGHGNLIQREDAEAIFKNARKALYEQSRKERINDFQTRELMLLNAEQFVHLIQPIIKADAESEE